MNTNFTKAQLINKFRDKSYRDSFVAAHIATNSASQILSMRTRREWTQTDLAERTGMAQTRISVLEDPNYENFSIMTLKRLASAFDVALIVRFVPFSELVNWVVSLSPQDLAVRSFEDDLAMPIPAIDERRDQPVSDFKKLGVDEVPFKVPLANIAQVTAQGSAAPAPFPPQRQPPSSYRTLVGITG